MHVINSLLSLTNDPPVSLLHVKVRVEHIYPDNIIIHVSWAANACFCIIFFIRFNIFLIFTRARITTNDVLEGNCLALVFFMIDRDKLLVDRRKLTRFSLMNPLWLLPNNLLCNYLVSLAIRLRLIFFFHLTVLVFIFRGVIIIFDFFEVRHHRFP